ncbi:DUF6291 domain-containing protein [Alistipes sp.]|uniref:DUF6291 domain-containing protein n=2 Tax=Alistipes sp. TaxID=1872444 RepID=UPI003AB47E28
MMSKAKSISKERNGFTFFRSFRDAVEMTSEEEQLVLYKAIADYALDGVEPDISTLGALGRLCWTALRPNLESGIIRFRNGCNGGAPVGNQNARKTTENQPENNQKTTYPLLNEGENENVDENEEGNKRSKRPAFVAPSLQEVKDYVSEKGYTVDAQRFIDFYESKGWMIGKNKMKDWRAAVRTWTRRPDETPKQTNHETRKPNFL